MTRRWLRLLQNASCVGAFVVGISTFPLDTLHAQVGSRAAGPAGGPSVAASAPGDFAVAPSLLLGYSPTSIAAGHLTSSGYLDIVTADYNSGQVRIYLRVGAGVFAAPIAYSTGAHPAAIAIADINGDGKADVVVAEESDATISIFPGNGDGTLAPRRTYSVGFHPSILAIGDFSGSGRLDVATASQSGNTLAILQNEGSGKLSRPVNVALSTTPSAMSSADFDHDGHSDVALANANGTVSILMGRGNAQFTRLPDMAVSRGALSAIVAGDFNRDGQVDLAVTSASENRLAVMTGLGGGKFSSPRFYDVGNAPVTLHVADLDGDGIPDLVAINRGNNTFSVLSGRGDGTFGAAVHFVVGNTPMGAVIGDFYGNGHVDLATIDLSSRTLSVPAGKGDGTFSAGRAYSAGSQPVSVASGDLNGDGTADLVVANYCATDASCADNGSAAVLLAGPGDAYQLASTYPLGAGSISIALIDINRDKKLDLVALNRVDKTLSLRLGAGDGTFGQLITIPLAAAPVAMAWGDFNKDGNLDLAVLEDCGSGKCTQPGEVEFLAGSGDGNFRSLSTYPVGYSPAALAVGATRLNGNADVLVANRCGQDPSCQTEGTATILFGEGTGAFKPGTDIPLGNNPSSIALASLRSSGVLDLVVARSTDNGIAVLPGTGKGSFGPSVPYAVGKAPGALAVADFNGDGKPDVAVANSGDASVSVLFGQGDGTLQPAFSMPLSGNPMAIAAIGTSTMVHASLATANGTPDSSSSQQSDITVVSNLRPQPMLGAGGGTTTSSTALVSGTNPSKVNQSDLLSVTVTGLAGSGNPAGNVVFSSDGSALSDCGGSAGLAVTPGTGVTSTVSCTTSVLTASSAGHSLTAKYLGDTVYDFSTSPAVTQVVNKATTTLTIAGPTAASAVNTSVTFTATLGGTFTPVAPTTGSTTTSTVAFFADGSSTAISGCATSQLTVAAGVYTATCTTKSLDAATHSISATYSGDANFTTSSTTASASYTPTKAATTLTIAAPAASAVNTSVTFTATLDGTFTPIAPTTGSTTTSTVAFFADGSGTAISGCATSQLTVAAGVYTATCTTKSLDAATHSISATYSGDTNFTTSNTTAPASYTPTKAATTLTIAAPGTASPVNTSVTFTATLGGTFTPVAPTTGSATTSTVAFFADGSGTAISGCATSQLTVSAGVYTATCTTKSLDAATHSISATYSGDTNFAASSTTAPASYTPAKEATTLTIAAPAASAVNSSATFTATLGGTFTPVAPTTGSTTTSTVAFFADGSATAISGCATSQLTVSAGVYTATCTTKSLDATTHKISATYSGDTNFAASSTTAPASYTPTKLAGTLSTASSVGGSTSVGTSVTFTVTYAVSPVTPFAPTSPTSNVTFTINGVASPLCPATTINSSQQATCTTSDLPADNYVIGASYGGDTNFDSATAPTINLNVKKAAPTVGLTSNATPPYSVDQQVTLTATVPNPAGGTVQPTGSVTFKQGSTTLCSNAGLNTATPPQAVCTYSFPSPVAAPGTITATYSSDSNFTAGTAGTMIGTVNTATTTTTIASSGTVSVGQTVTFTTVIKPQNGSHPTIPQGTVTFTTNASPAPTGTCTSTLTVASDGTVPTCTFIFNAGGTFNVSAQYTSANSNFSGSSSNTVSQPVNAGTLGINLTSSKSPASVNEPVTFSAAFTPSIPTPVPSGSVTYADSGTTLCTVAVSGTGTIPDCTFTFTVAGSHSIVATLPKSGSYAAASSNMLAEVVNQNPIATTVTASTATASVNEQVTFTATLAPATFSGATGTLAVPGGTVTFNQSSSGGTSAACSNVAITTVLGVLTATCKTAFTSIGTYTVSAQYNQVKPDNFVQGTVTSTQVQVGTTSTSVTVSGPSNFTYYVNESTGVTFTATVTPQTSGSANPTGSMTFTDSVAGTDICIPQTVTPDGSGGATASCAMIFRSAGSHTITAKYSGDPNFPTASASTVPAITVNATKTTISTSSSGPVSANQPATYTTTLTPEFGGAGATIPKGNVTFAATPATTLSGTCSAGVQLALDGAVPNCTLIFPAAGTYNVTATFNPGDSNFATSTSNQVSQSITKAGATVVVTPVAASVTNQVVTFTAAFSPLITGTQPTGTMSFNATLGSQTLALCTNQPVSTSAGVTRATCSAALMAAGSYAVTATYNGDANFSSTTSAAATQVVNKAPTAAVVTSSSGAGATATSSVNQEVTFTVTITPQVANSASVPTGTVTFFDNNNTAAPLCSGVIVTSGSGGTAVATCKYTFAATGTNTISASYTGDSNFVSVAQGTSTPVTQNVIAPNSTLSVTPPPSATVNQTVTYTVLITPTSKGTTTPTGNVTFTDTGDATTLVCAPAPLIGDSNSGTSSAKCTIIFLNVGAHTIAASYPGDNNFTSGSDQATAVTVAPSVTSVQVTSSAAPSFSKQTVTFVATVSPTPNAGPSLQVPTGAVTFSDATGFIASQCPNPVSLANPVNGQSSATCTVTFPHLAAPPGQYSVAAAYSAPDKNFLTSTGNFVQTVQDFNTTLSVVPSNSTSISSGGGVYLTQGNETNLDPFGPATMTAGISTSAGYNPTMSVLCAVYSSAGAQVADPSCDPLQPQPVPISGNKGRQAFAVKASSSAPVDKYTIRFTIYDPLDPNSQSGALNAQSTAQSVEFSLFVVAPSPRVTLAQGAAATESVIFNTAQASSTTITVSSVDCPQIWDNTNPNAPQLLDNTSHTRAVCSGPPANSTINVTGASTPVSVKINTAVTSGRNQQGADSTYLATMLGAPLFAVIVWFASRRSSRRNLLRFFGIVLLFVGLSFATSCGGGSYSLTTTGTPSGTGLAPGSYLVEVVMVDTNGTFYYAQVPLTVTANQ